MVVYRGKIYFTGNDGFTGNEPYVYDPATGTSSMLADVRSGGPSSDANNYIVGNDTLYFSASNTTGPTQLYKYSGSDTPVCITSLVNGFQGFNGHLAYYKGMLVFSADNNDGKGVELYKYDVVTKVTSLVYDINPGSSSSGPTGFAVYRSKIYFSANDGTHGSELWVWDGTSNPYMLADIDSGGATSSSYPVALTVWNGSLYMNALNSKVGTELFKYTDTTSGVVNVVSSVDIKVYPVPASAICKIELGLKNDTRMSLAIVDVAGRSVYNKATENYTAGHTTINIDMHSWVPGNYYYYLRKADGTTIATGRLVKQE